MQKIKTVQIGTRSFTLKELPVRVVWELVNNREAENPEAPRLSMVDRFQQLLTLACPELSTEGMLDLYPSELQDLWQGFEEVNAAFLGVVRTIGLDQALIEAARTTGISIVRSVSASNPAMVPESGTTDTASS